jgi:hypothetical protein
MGPVGTPGDSSYPSQEPPLNPYATTSESIPSAGVSSGANAVHTGDAGMVGHVQALGVLQIVLGAMELLMGTILIFYAVVFFELPAVKQQPPPPAAMWAFTLVMGVSGGVVVLFSFLRIASGVLSFRFAGRKMMLVSLIGGMVTAMTCYCAPFSISLGIYGLVVMLNPAVIHAFKMASEGWTAEQIRAYFWSTTAAREQIKHGGGE